MTHIKPHQANRRLCAVHSTVGGDLRKNHGHVLKLLKITVGQILSIPKDSQMRNNFAPGPCRRQP